jgi:hypothetical protein
MNLHASFRGWLLVVVLLAVTAFAGVIIWGVGTSWGAGVASIGSAVSALVALLISLRSQSYDIEKREADRKKVEAERIEARRGMAAECAAEIEAWLLRNDLSALLRAVQSVSNGASADVTIIGGLQVALAARNSIVTTGDSPPVHLLDTIDDCVDRIAAKLALGEIQRLTTIPTGWLAQLRMSQIGVLGPSALPFFIRMNAVWTNLVQMVNQIETVDQMRRQIHLRQWPHVAKYLEAVEHEVVAFRALLLEFMKAANTCVRVLSEHDDVDVLSELKAPVQAMKGLQVEAFGKMAEVQRFAEFDDAIRKMRDANRRSEQWKADLADFSLSLQKETV